METSYAERHIKSLSLAKTCAELGARIKTISFVTGLGHHELVRLFFVDEHSAPRGRPPASPEWFHQANLIEQVEASLFCAIFERLSAAGYGPPEALVGAYRTYRELGTQPPRISFDRGFDLVCHVRGIWAQRERHFSLNVCPACHSQYLAAFGAQARQPHGCPFCKLVKRYPADKRVQTCFTPAALPPLAAADFGLLRWFIGDDSATAPS